MTEAVVVVVNFIQLLFVALVLRHFKKLRVKEAFEELHAMAAQFRTDSGSSLRDVVNRLEHAAENNRVAAEDMKINVRDLKALAGQTQVELESLLRMAEAQKTEYRSVASDLAVAQEAVEGVASDLAESRKDDE
jgi:hypothetical protein